MTINFIFCVYFHFVSDKIDVARGELKMKLNHWGAFTLEKIRTFHWQKQHCYEFSFQANALVRAIQAPIAFHFHWFAFNSLFLMFRFDFAGRSWGKNIRSAFFSRYFDEHSFCVMYKLWIQENFEYLKTVSFLFRKWNFDFITTSNIGFWLIGCSGTFRNHRTWTWFVLEGFSLFRDLTNIQ